MRVLGVDPGLTRCGVAVVDAAAGTRPQLVALGVIRTDKGLSTGERLLRLEHDLDQWVKQTKPDQIGVERVFTQHNLHTVAGIMQAEGLVLMIAARYGIPVEEHTPSEVKAAVTGSGRADKAQITAMVTRILRLSEPPQPPDAADAIAIALCHLWRSGATNRLAKLENKAALNNQASSQAKTSISRQENKLGSR